MVMHRQVETFAVLTMNAFRINLNFKFPRYGTSARGIADEGKASWRSLCHRKLAKMLKSLSVLASRCNVRASTGGDGRGKLKGIRSDIPVQ